MALLRRSITIRYRVDGVLSLTFLGAEYISLGKYSVFEGSGDRSGYVRAGIAIEVEKLSGLKSWSRLLSC